MTRRSSIRRCWRRPAIRSCSSPTPGSCSGTTARTKRWRCSRNCAAAAGLQPRMRLPRSLRSRWTRNAMTTRRTCSRTRRAIRSRPMACAGSRAASPRRAATRSAPHASTRASSPARAHLRASCGHSGLLRDQGASELAEMLMDDYVAAVPADTVDAASGVAAILVEEGKGDACDCPDRSCAQGDAG